MHCVAIAILENAQEPLAVLPLERIGPYLAETCRHADLGKILNRAEQLL
jgi:hypothetical protein